MVLTVQPSGAFTLAHDGSTPMRTEVGGNVFSTAMSGTGHGTLKAGNGQLTLVTNDFAQTVTAQQQTPLDRRAERLVLALVFAAKSDGHIDDRERAAIESQLRDAGIEEQGRVLVEQAINQPLDPMRLAADVKNEEEALELYFLSCAAIDVDHFMERSYLQALGDALKIPQEVREEIERDIQQEKKALPG